MKNKIICTFASFLSVFLLLLVLIYRTETAEGVKSALSQSASGVIPSLFAFITLSGVISSLDLLEPIYRKIPTEKLFCLSRYSSQAVLIGLLCGFPVGATVVNNLYSRGKITKNEAERLLAVSSCPSPAFLIGAVGAYYSNAAYGAGLYLTSVMSCLLFGVITKKSMDSAPRFTEAPPQPKMNFTRAMCESVNRAGLTCLSITAYITFFSVMRNIVSAMLPFTVVRDVTSALFEFSYGAYYGSIVKGLRGFIITGLAIGFSSLSIFLQSANSAPELSMKPFFYSKLMSVVLCVVYSAVYWYFFGSTITPSAQVPAFSAVSGAVLPLAVVAVITIISGIVSKKINFRMKY